MIRSSSQNSGTTGTDLNVSVPAGAQVGDKIIVAAVANGQTTIVDNNGSTPFTEDINDYKPNTSNGITISIFSRVLQSGDPTTFHFTSGASGRWSIVAICPEGGQYDVSPSTANAANVDDASSGSISAPAITVANNAIHIVIATWDTSAIGTITTPSGYTLLENANGGGEPLHASYKSFTTGGSTGSVSCDNSEFGARIALSFSILSATSIAVSDTASGDDSTQSIRASILSSESASGSDILSGLLVKVPLTDSSVGADNLQALLAKIAIQETTSASDAVSERALVQQIDSGNAAEIDAVSVVLSTLADTLSGVDAVSLLSIIAQMDSFSGSDIVNVVSSANQVSVSDTGAGSELIGIIAICRILESCAGADNLSILARTQVSDASGGSDSIFQSARIPTVDTASGADIARIVARLNVIDFASGYEVLSLAVAVSQTDPCVAADTIATLNRLAMIDSAIGNEYAYIAGQAILSETGAGDDAAQLMVYIFSSDSAKGAESIVKIWKKIYTKVSGKYDTITGKYTKVSGKYGTIAEKHTKMSSPYSHKA